MSQSPPLETSWNAFPNVDGSFREIVWRNIVPDPFLTIREERAGLNADVFQGVSWDRLDPAAEFLRRSETVFANEKLRPRREGTVPDAKLMPMIPATDESPAVDESILQHVVPVDVFAHFLHEWVNSQFLVWLDPRIETSVDELIQVPPVKPRAEADPGLAVEEKIPEDQIVFPAVDLNPAKETAGGTVKDISAHQHSGD